MRAFYENLHCQFHFKAGFAEVAGMLPEFELSAINFVRRRRGRNSGRTRISETLST
jgi:hypothetical protein